MDDLLTIAQVAERAGVSRQCVYNWIKSGRLKAEHFGGGQKVARHEVEGFLASYKPAVREAGTSSATHEGAAG